jgi:hypothetical protein
MHEFAPCLILPKHSQTACFNTRAFHRLFSHSHVVLKVNLRLQISMHMAQAAVPNTRFLCSFILTYLPSTVRRGASGTGSGGDSLVRSSLSRKASASM